MLSKTCQASVLVNHHHRLLPETASDYILEMQPFRSLQDSCNAFVKKASRLGQRHDIRAVACLACSGMHPGKEKARHAIDSGPSLSGLVGRGGLEPTTKGL